MFKEKLQEALDKRKNDINSFIWKGKKYKENGETKQEEIRLMDCTVEQLNEFLKHCDSMLYSTNKKNPGRYQLLEIIKEQRNKCNTELFLRWLDTNNGFNKYTFLITLREFLNNNPHIDPKKETIGIAVGNCPKEFIDIPIDMVLDGCMDSLGLFDKRHITLTFLLNLGVWFTPEELKKMNKEKVTNKEDYIKKHLGINPREDIKINPKGLSLSQMCSMVTLRTKKYSDLTTLQLETLRNKVLFSLEHVVNIHIKQWESRKEQINKVLEIKNNK